MSLQGARLLTSFSIPRVPAIRPLGTLFLHRNITTFYPTMAPSKSEKEAAKKSSSNPSHELEGEKNEWKFRAPYKVHSNEDDKFKALYEGGCHCGRVKYQLSRKKPLDSKYCHCSTCQVLHGTISSPFEVFLISSSNSGLRICTLRFNFLPFRASFEDMVLRVANKEQELPSSGQPSSTRRTSTLPMVTMI